MVFGVFVFGKRQFERKQTMLPSLRKRKKKKNNKGIMVNINKTTNRKQRLEKRRSNTDVTCRLVVLRVDICAPWVVENSLNADSSLDVAIQHLADEVDAVFAHDIWHS